MLFCILTTVGKVSGFGHPLQGATQGHKGELGPHQASPEYVCRAMVLARQDPRLQPQAGAVGTRECRSGRPSHEPELRLEGLWTASNPHVISHRGCLQGHLEAGVRAAPGGGEQGPAAWLYLTQTFWLLTARGVGSGRALPTGEGRPAQPAPRAPFSSSPPRGDGFATHRAGSSIPWAQPGRLPAFGVSSWQRSKLQEGATQEAPLGLAIRNPPCPLVHDAPCRKSVASGGRMGSSRRTIYEGERGVSTRVRPPAPGTPLPGICSSRLGCWRLSPGWWPSQRQARGTGVLLCQRAPCSSLSVCAILSTQG